MTLKTASNTRIVIKVNDSYKKYAKTLWQGAICKSELRILIKLNDGRSQSYGVVVSTSVVPTENGGSIPPRTCGQDAGLRLTLNKCSEVVKYNATDVWG